LPMRWRRIPLILLVAILTGAVVLAAPGMRTAALQSIARVLVVDDPLPDVPVDVVMVAVDAGSAGVLEAANLVQTGVANRVAVFAPPPGRVDLELLGRGLTYDDSEARLARELAALGVKNIVRLPRVAGTEEQGGVLPAWCREHRIRSLVLVTSWHHSRRVRRVLERDMQRTPVEFSVRVARYSDFGPEDWWQTHEGLRVAGAEMQKLLWDVLRHPL